MIVVVAAVIGREDRRILIGQRKKTDSSPLKWEFPGGKMRLGELPEEALGRELREELRATLLQSVEIGRVRHKYGSPKEELEIRFFAASISAGELTPLVFEEVKWVLPKELVDYDFLAANAEILGRLATGVIKIADVLQNAAETQTS